MERVFKYISKQPGECKLEMMLFLAKILLTAAHNEFNIKLQH